MDEKTKGSVILSCYSVLGALFPSSVPPQLLSNNGGKIQTKPVIFIAAVSRRMAQRRAYHH